MKLFKLNKDSWKQAHWWEKQKRDWAIQDKDGVWWIVPGSEMAEKKAQKKLSKNRIKESSMVVTPERMLLIITASVLGVSLALNVVYYLLR